MRSTRTTARRLALVVATPVAVAALLTAGISAVHAEDAPAQDGQLIHTDESGIADQKPPQAVNEYVTGSASAAAPNLPDGLNAITADGEQCPQYRWAVSEKQDVLVYNEKWSNFNGTDQPNEVTLTTTKDTTWDWHVEGTLSGKILGAGVDVTAGGGQSFTTSKGVSNTATANPKQWITAMFGAWFTKQTASDLTCIHPDGTDGTHDSGTFEIWLPAGASGWMFTNDPPSKQ